MYPPGPGALGMPTGAIMGGAGRWAINFWALSMSLGSKFRELFSSIRFLLIAFVPDGTRVVWERQFRSTGFQPVAQIV